MVARCARASLPRVAREPPVLVLPDFGPGVTLAVCPANSQLTIGLYLHHRCGPSTLHPAGPRAGAPACCLPTPQRRGVRHSRNSGSRKARRRLRAVPRGPTAEPHGRPSKPSRQPSAPVGRSAGCRQNRSHRRRSHKSSLRYGTRTGCMRGSPRKPRRTAVQRRPAAPG
jgi:hypothetical protein